MQWHTQDSKETGAVQELTLTSGVQDVVTSAPHTGEPCGVKQTAVAANKAAEQRSISSQSDLFHLSPLRREVDSRT